MQKQPNLEKWLGVALILLQLFDIIVHVRTNQVEPIRIVANIVVIAWVIAAIMGWLQARQRTRALAVISIYLLLNLIFLAQNGLTNPAQGDAPRIVLFILAIVTTVLSGLFASRTAVSNRQYRK